MSTTPHPTQTERRRHILGNTLVVTTAFGLAAAMGLVRNMIIAARFGIGPELDAFYAAFKLPICSSPWWPGGRWPRRLSRFSPISWPRMTAWARGGWPAPSQTWSSWSWPSLPGWPPSPRPGWSAP